MYCFAPSSTHEQPEEARVESSRVTRSDAKVKKAKKQPEDEVKGGDEAGTAAADGAPAPGGASPMAFLKSMTGGGKDKGSGSRESSRSAVFPPNNILWRIHFYKHISCPRNPNASQPSTFEE